MRFLFYEGYLFVLICCLLLYSAVRSTQGCIAMYCQTNLQYSKHSTLIQCNRTNSDYKGIECNPLTLWVCTGILFAHCGLKGGQPVTLDKTYNTKKLISGLTLFSYKCRWALYNFFLMDFQFDACYQRCHHWFATIRYLANTGLFSLSFNIYCILITSIQ